MPAFKLDTFGGMIPATDETILPQASSVHSENTWLYPGKLAGMRTFDLIKTLTAGTAKVFRLPNTLVDSEHIADSVWMEFQNPHTDVVRSLVIGDTFDRYYWASSSAQPMYNTRARIAAASNAFKLGIPAPGAPSITVTGGAAADVTRSYLATWVSAYGEEGPAGVPLVKTGKPDGSWDITLVAAATNDTNGVDRNLTKVRIYRTVVSSAGIASFFLVAEQVISDTTYSDTQTDAQVSLNNVLESTNWTAPPTDLQGFIPMPNGFLAGWRNNEIWFSEPYRPHAWPASYSIVVDFPIVGLGVIGQTLVACTQGYPVLVTGIHPSTMAQAKSASLEPCMSRGSILSTEEGVYYASPNGLVFAAGGQVLNVTRKLITKDKWQSTVPITSLNAARLGSGYFAFGGKTFGVFDDPSFETTAFTSEELAGAYNGVLIDPNDQRVAFNLLSDRVGMTNVFSDPWSGEVLLIKSDKLYRVHLAAANPVPQVYKWRSKVFEANEISNLAAMRVRWRLPDVAPTPPIDPVPGQPLLAEFPALPAGVVGYVRAYADGVQVWQRQMIDSGELMRLPSGFKAEFWQFEFETYAEIVSVQFGTSAKALASV